MSQKKVKGVKLYLCNVSKQVATSDAQRLYFARKSTKCTFFSFFPYEIYIRGRGFIAASSFLVGIRGFVPPILNLPIRV